MPTRRYIENFLMIADNEYPDSYFLDDFSINHVSEDDCAGARRFTGDLIEIDGAGRMHLWLFAPYRATELVSGDAIGRMFAFTQVLRLTAADTLRDAITAAARRRRYDVGTDAFRSLVAKPRLDVESWNVVMCGGTGCELIERGDNLLFQLYAPLSEWDGPARDVNTWQFRQTATGFDLRSIWDIATHARMTVAEQLDIFAGRAALPTPDDDFDIGCKRDLKLKRRKGLHAEAHAAWCGTAVAAAE